MSMENQVASIDIQSVIADNAKRIVAMLKEQELTWQHGNLILEAAQIFYVAQERVRILDLYPTADAAKARTPTFDPKAFTSMEEFSRTIPA